MSAPRVVRAMLIAGLLAVLSFIAAPVSGAHTVLVSSDPAADTVLPAGPARVSATFNEEIQPTFAAMTVVGPDGNLWSEGDAQVRGPVLSVAVRPLGPAGRYTANYRVTSADGHVVTGSWAFNVASKGTGSPGPSAGGSAGADAGSGGGTPQWVRTAAPLLIGGAVLSAGVVVWLLRRRS